MDSKLPGIIRQLVAGLDFTGDAIGKSAAAVRIYPDRVLKTGPICQENRDSLQMLHWLDGKLPVQKILASVDEGSTNWLLMSRIPGKMACDPSLMADPQKQTGLLARALERMWSVDVADCPCDQSLDKKLKMAEGFVAKGQCSMDDTEPGTYGPGGFRDPEDLLYWLIQNKPAEQPVLSHGDFCLPNVFILGEQVSGFIDLDHCGKADKYQDIALCYRSLQHNFNGKYGHFPGYDPQMLFDALGIRPDMDLIRYYILLDELF